ncbi:arabinose 5-phosphate isomerase KdsD [mine drainage metagenome]|uniref:Arabinose 5-phosphate isomerase KdsD n=1 Tax=mine drainage metagenome TaxID=410659 RepID=A0A1J5QDD8_9ZZZZ
MRELSAGAVMHAQPRTIDAQALAVEAVELMEQHRITQIPVVDDAQRLIGALNLHDLFAAKVM